MARITEDGRKSLKRLVVNLRSISQKYTMVYHDLVKSLCVQYVFIVFWLFHIVVYWSFDATIEYSWIFLMASVAIFLYLFVSGARFRRTYYLKLKKLQRRGDSDLGELMRLVDWGVFRKRQLYNNTDERVGGVVVRFMEISRRPLSPKKNQKSIALGLVYCAIGIEFILLMASIWCFGEITTYFEDMFYDAVTIAVLCVCVMSFVIGLVVMIMFVTKRIRLTEKYEEVIAGLSEKVLSIGHVSELYIEAVTLKDDHVEFARETYQLLSDYSKIYSSSLENAEDFDLTHMNAEELESVFQNLNRLGYYIDEKIDYINQGLIIDENVLDSQRNVIEDCLAIKVGKNKFWDALGKTSKLIYGKDWLPHERMPYQYHIVQRIMKMELVFLILYLMLLVLGAILVLIQGNVCPLWMQIFMGTFACVPMFQIVRIYKKRLDRIALMKW